MNPVTHLWVVSGMPGQAFPIKEDAERAARNEFPNENPNKRYARIYEVTLWATAEGKLDLVRRLGRLP